MTYVFTNYFLMISGKRTMLIGLAVLISTHIIYAQSAIRLDDLSFFATPGPAWKIVGDVKADPYQKGAITITAGTGILVNYPDKKNPGQDLFSSEQYGDLDVEFDYLVAKGVNAGVFLQGRYEVQLCDSWGIKVPKATDNGGINERWEERKPEGQKGFEGYAPRQNVSRAPGLWQHMKISFMAPRFDASGKKTTNAKMLRVELNGVVIHENVELFGVTRGAIGNESPLGPLRIQGDGGSIAFRNFTITSFDKPRPKISDLKFEIFKGKFNSKTDFALLKAEQNGSATLLGEGVTAIGNEFAIRYTGTLAVAAPGEYSFILNAVGGAAALKIDNREIIQLKEWQSRGKVSLQQGSFPLEIVYSKYIDWAQAALSVSIAGPGFREYLASDRNLSSGNVVDPILVKETENKLLRSFMDLPGGHRVVHAISAGSVDKLHYTYDMDNGTIVQIWRGEFLDATPMWHSRGDGSSRPVGSVLRFGKPLPSLAKLTSMQSPWTTDTTGSAFRTKGYTLSSTDEPTFRYRMFGASVSDALKVVDHGQGIVRSLTVDNPPNDLYIRLARGKSIEKLSETLYRVDDKSYYIKIDDANKKKAIIRDINGQKEIVIPVQNKITYSILF